jgi:signal transduction histidine kinase
MSKKRNRRASREAENRSVGIVSPADMNRDIDSGAIRLVESQQISPLYRYAFLFSRGSLFGQMLRHVGLSYDDDATVLAASPLGMFFYNQRFLFFALGLLYIVALQIAATVTDTPNTRTTVMLVLAFWSAAVAVTLLAHKRFIRQVAAHMEQTPSSDFPPVFYSYVVFDSALVLGLVFLASWQFQVDLHYFAFLLLANTIVYCACAGAHVSSRRTFAAIPVLLLIFIAALLIVTRGMRNGLFVAFRDMGPVLGMAVVAVMAVAIVSAVRQREQKLMHSQVKMLGRLEEDLGGSSIYQLKSEAKLTPKEQFEQRLRAALKRLTTIDNAFGYRGARIWFIDERDEHRAYLLPGPFHGIKSFNADVSALQASTELLQARTIRVVRNSKELPFLPEPIRDDYELANESVAYVPVLANGRLAAALTFHGLPEDPGTKHHQETFLYSVSAILADTLVQADVRHSSQATEAIDALFRFESLSDVLPKAAEIFMRSTRAEACLIATRSKASDTEVRLVAASGFRRKTSEIAFDDDVVAHVAIENKLWLAFDSEIDLNVKQRLEVLHGRSVFSCLGIPFSASFVGSGVVLLVNSIGRAPWFSRNDVHLGQRLAHLVGRLIERFDRMESTKASLKLAMQREKDASEAALRAENLAKQIQNNIMVMTHQLQAPLSSMRASVYRLRRKIQQPEMLHHLDHVQGLVEDSFALCWGTVATFAKDAGTTTSIELQDVDAMPELESLAMRMQKTNARSDLKFEFHAEPDFPNIYIDKFVFTSVFYSLLHNAMKYADKNSRVEMVCGFENGRAALKLKSFGEPIGPEEKDEIFKMYRRGRVVTETGRHHAGVGLGLWVARQLLNEVDGTIDVEVADRLSIFIVRCPIATAGGTA